MKKQPNDTKNNKQLLRECYAMFHLVIPVSFTKVLNGRKALIYYAYVTCTYI